MMELLNLLLVGNFCIPILIVLTLLFIYWWKAKPGDLPPGPIGLPIVGYLPFISRPAHLAFERLSKKYGPIFHMYLGSQLVIVLNDYESIKEAFVKQADVFSGRTQDANFFKKGVERIGITNADGESWRQHRRFIMSNLKDNGVGKLSLEPLLLNEIHCFMNELKKTCGEPTAMNELLCKTFLNNIHILVTGNRYDYEDSTFQEMVKIVETISSLSDLLAIPTFMPWTSAIPNLRFIGKLDIRREYSKDLIEIIKKIINDNKFNRNNLQYENLADAYTDKIQNQKTQTEKPYFSPDGLMQTCRDLLFAGTETSAKTLLWGMIYLTNNPHVQSKVQDEIDLVIGRGRDPSYNDHSRTPYTVATINEIHRMVSLVPLSLAHRTIKDSHIFGYYIPKNTTIFPNIWSVHYDPKLWGDPDNFRPERFLSPDGQLVTHEHLIPFSLGKRACAGEPLARMEVYLYLTSFLQNFKLVSKDGSKLPLDAKANFGRHPLYDKICFESR